jgi:hypothetical protein
MHDLSFLRRVDLRDLDAFVVEKDLHLIEQELVRVGIRNVESEVVDKLFLFRLPLRPAILADLSSDLLSKLGRDWSYSERLIFLTTPRAFEFVTSE